MHGREYHGHHGNYVKDTWKKPSSLQAKRISSMTRGLREGLWRGAIAITGRVVEGFKRPGYGLVVPGDSEAERNVRGLGVPLFGLVSLH